MNQTLNPLIEKEKTITIKVRQSEVILYCADVRSINLPPKSVGTIVTDPPFGIGKEGTIIRREGGKFGKAKPINTTIADWDINPVSWKEYLPSFWEWLDDVGILILFHNKLEIVDIARWWEAKGGKVRHIAVWCIPNTAPQARKVKWKSATNFVLICTKNKGSGHAYHWKYGQNVDYYVCPTVPGVKRWKNSLNQTHPTEKPLELFTHWLLKWWGDRNKIILDPFCGSGTIPLAAVHLGFKTIIAGDVDASWVEATANRIRGIEKPHINVGHPKENDEATLNQSLFVE